MDDFGTGYSSLAYLKRFPFDTVKIDQSFVRGIPGSSDDIAIVEAIIAMAHSLQLKVVAEGVETEDQLNMLRKLGCDTIQGYFFSKPIPSNEVVMLLFKTLRGPNGVSGSSQDIESTQRMAVPAELRQPRPPVQDIEKTQKVALASVGPADPAPAVATPEAKPAEAFEFKIELPAEFDTPAPGEQKAKEA
jgi:hypothetical protein